ncbi:MAG: hypothetical protein DYH15_11415 [Nitrosomonas sp. PRO4]|nr:hypothetical protein [Nitrosomonas sp. PRO4]
MYKKVYVAIDASEFSKQALTTATKIAETFKSSLCIAHCVNEDTESGQEAGLAVLARRTLRIVRTARLLAAGTRVEILLDVAAAQLVEIRAAGGPEVAQGPEAEALDHRLGRVVVLVELLLDPAAVVAALVLADEVRGHVGDVDVLLFGLRRDHDLHAVHVAAGHVGVAELGDPSLGRGVPRVDPPGALVAGIPGRIAEAPAQEGHVDAGR